MERYIRGDKKQVPVKLRKFLTDAQFNALDAVAQFGWSVAFVRRPPFQQPVVVMVNETGNKYGVLQEDGSLNQNPDITLRSENPSANKGITVKKGRSRQTKPKAKRATVQKTQPVHKAG